MTGPFSKELQSKIDPLLLNRPNIKLGCIEFSSPLLLAPMSSICHAPFRLLMEQLGAGGTVSELISCHGINYGNEKTRQMLTILPEEKHVGIQLFGENAESMARAAEVAQAYHPKFIDINMGCPVKKVVKKGGGSALLQEPSKLAHFFSTIKRSLKIPLTIKIRTGWDEDSINASEVIHIAKEEGVEFVAVHGRTRTQAYRGQANWSLLESLAQVAPLPLIGNGDLHTSHMTKQRMLSTRCQALMLGRGPLRNPFIFLESFLSDPSDSPFTAKDYLEVIYVYFHYLSNYTQRERTLLIQMRKMIVWFVAGFPGVAQFRGLIFKTSDIETTLKVTEDYLLSIHQSGQSKKKIDLEHPFMAGGHG